MVTDTWILSLTYLGYALFRLYVLGEIGGECTLECASSFVLPHPSLSSRKGIAKLLLVTGREVRNCTEQVECLEVLHL